MTEKEAINHYKRTMQIHKDEFGYDRDDRITDLYNTTINALRELQQYRAIGTIEECQEMEERQEAKQPYIWGAWDDAIPDMYYCPNCGESYGIGVDDYDYCPKCGQAFDKSDLAKQYE